MQVIDDHFPVYSPAVENGSEYSFLFWLDTFQRAGDSTGEDTFRLEKDHPGGQIKHLDIIHVDDCIQAGDSDFFPTYMTYMTFSQLTWLFYKCNLIWVWVSVCYWGYLPPKKLILKKKR